MSLNLISAAFGSDYSSLVFTQQSYSLISLQDLKGKSFGSVHPSLISGNF